METLTTPQFDASKYKKTTLEQWQSAAEAWYRWSPAINRWLGKATEKMLDLAEVSSGQKVLDIAAGAGEQSITAAKRVGAMGHVLATDLSPNILEFAKEMAKLEKLNNVGTQVSPNILEFAKEMAKSEKLNNIETQVMDGENLSLPDNTFDVVISRVGLIYFPDQQKALREMWRVLKPGGRVAAIVYSTAEKNKFFSGPVSIIRRRANLPPPLPGQPGPFSLGAPGVIEDAYQKAGFKKIKSILVDSPVFMSSASQCVQFEKESFGALHQMLSGLTNEEKNSVWEEIEKELRAFEVNGSFVGPCEMIVAVGQKE
jgi:ubiquinone/menaquinone biosynthesis C-methylase UbiE